MILSLQFCLSQNITLFILGRALFVLLHGCLHNFSDFMNFVFKKSTQNLFIYVW